MRKCLIILMAALAFSCSDNVPKGILTEEEITPILVELHLAEAIFSQRNSLEITRENYQEDLYLTILKKHKLDQKAFEASVLYYGKHPDKYKPIYDEVLNRLNEMEVKAKIKDSIDSRKPIIKPIVKDTLILKDTVRIKKTAINIKPKDSIKILDVKSKANIAIRNQKTALKSNARDTAKVIK
jgi:hypothetical protein